MSQTPPSDAPFSSSDPRIQKISDAIWVAADVCLNIYKKENFDVNYKSDNSPVTEADIAVNDILTTTVLDLFPEIPVISEEAIPDYQERKDYKTYWLIDPIDGTKEFVKRTDQFTINLGLIHDGKPILGWIQAPVYKELYLGGPLFGGTNCYGYFNGKDLSKIWCTAYQAPYIYAPENLVVACSRDHRKPEDNEFIFKLSTDYYVKILPIGSTLKIAKIAGGGVHLYTRLSGINDWDLAAAHAVLLGAGGEVTTLDGKELVYNTESQKLAPFICHCKLSFDPIKYVAKELRD